MILRGMSFPLESAGTIRLSNDADVGVIGPLSTFDDRLQFGAFDLNVPKDTTLELSRMEYRRVERSFLDDILDFDLSVGYAAGAAGAAMVASADGEEKADLTRRQLLTMGAVSLGAAAAPVAARAATPDGTVDVVNIKVDRNESGAYFSLADSVADVLPPEAGEYVLTANGQQIDTFAKDDKWAVLPPGVTGDVSIITEADIGLWHKIRVAISGEPVLAFAQRLSQPADQLKAGTLVGVSTSPAIVRPLVEAGPSGAVVSLGDESIPHEEETGSEPSPVGSYFVSNETTFAYTAGEEPPDSDELEVRIRVDRLEETKDDVLRRLK